MQQVTRLPPLAVAAGGASLGELAQLLEGVRVSRALSQPAQCELAFAGEQASEVAAALAPGTDLKVSVGAHEDELFSGAVTATEWEQTPERTLVVRVRAYDRLHRLRQSQRLQTYTDVSVEGLASQLAGDAGLSVEAARSGPTWRRVIQHRRSDLELLADLALRAGLYLDLDGDRLRLFGLDGLGDRVALELGRSLLEARIALNSDPAVGSVEAAGWDLSRIEPHTGAASGDSRAEPADRATLLNLVAPTDEHATAAAQGELDRRAAGALTLWGLAEGDPALRPGVTVGLSGTAADGDYVLTSVVHTLDTRLGFVSEVSSAPPSGPARDDAAVITVGRVSSVDDPDGIGRVTVELAAYGGVESDWLGIVSAGAGSGKGYVAMPDVEDLVLVALSHMDPSQGVVLGGLYGGAGPFDAGVDGGHVRRFSFRTPGGQTLVFDDERKTLRLEDAQGSALELAGDAVLLSAKTDLTIEAPGRSIKIRSSSVDFETA